MDTFVKILELVLSWPVVTFVLGFMFLLRFQRPLEAFLSRTTRVSFPCTTIESQEIRTELKSTGSENEKAGTREGETGSAPPKKGETR